MYKLISYLQWAIVVEMSVSLAALKKLKGWKNRDFKVDFKTLFCSLL